MLIKLAAATTLPVTLDEAREYCRAPENGDDDSILRDALRGAVEYVQTSAGIVLQRSTFEHRLDAWPCWNPCRPGTISIPLSPVVDVTEIRYLDTNAAEQSIDAANWSWERTPSGADIDFISGYSLPVLHATRRGAVRIEFDAGYDSPEESGSGDEADLRIPDLARIVVKMLTELWYDNRGPVSYNQSFPAVATANEILGQLKVYR